MIKKTHENARFVPDVYQMSHQKDRIRFLMRQEAHERTYAWFLDPRPHRSCCSRCPPPASPSRRALWHPRFNLSHQPFLLMHYSNCWEIDTTLDCKPQAANPEILRLDVRQSTRRDAGGGREDWHGLHPHTFSSTRTLVSYYSAPPPLFRFRLDFEIWSQGEFGGG
jgi:hypothetical protein